MRCPGFPHLKQAWIPAPGAAGARGNVTGLGGLELVIFEKPDFSEIMWHCGSGSLALEGFVLKSAQMAGVELSPAVYAVFTSLSAFFVVVSRPRDFKWASATKTSH